jgi:hypothetical protein
LMAGGGGATYSGFALAGRGDAVAAGRGDTAAAGRGDAVAAGRGDTAARWGMAEFVCLGETRLPPRCRSLGVVGWDFT